MQFGHFSSFFRNGKLVKGGNATNQKMSKWKSNCINHKGMWGQKVVKIPSSYFDSKISQETGQCRINE